MSLINDCIFGGLCAAAAYPMRSPEDQPTCFSCMGSAGNRTSNQDLPSHRSRHPNATEAPDRTSHEANLRQINRGISRLCLQIKNYWTDARRTEIRDLQDQSRSFQEEFNSELVDEHTRQLALNDQLKEQTAKQAELHDIEDDLCYRNLLQAQQRLADVEQNYKRRSVTLREEKSLVVEMNRIKRNIVGLGKYLPLVEEKKQLDAEVKETRQELRTIRAKMRSAQDQTRNAKRKIRKLYAPYVDLKHQLHQLHAQKHQIVYQYEQKRHEYQLRPAQHPVATCPVVPGQDDGFDQYEPFCEEKNICGRLLRYLKSLKQNCEPTPQEIPTSPNELSGSSEDSADDFPSSFKLLSLAPPTPVVATRTHKRVKKYVKMTQPITHGLDHINMFSAINVEIPKTYGEVYDAISAVEKVLAEYMEQTELGNFNFDRDDESPSLVFSTSASEFNDSPLPSPGSSSS